MAIISYRTEDLQAVFDQRPPSRRFPSDIVAATRRKLVMLNNARAVEDLRHSGGNRLEALKGGRVGQFSIRINDQYRLCFLWGEAGPEVVEFVDYH